MHAKVIILDGTLSHITDVYLFVNEKDSIFFQKIPEKVSLSGEQKNPSNISELKSGTWITWSITTGVWIIVSKLKLHWCHASCSHESISGFLTCSITLLYDLFCRKLLKHSTSHSQWFHHAQGWTWPMRLVPVIMEMRVMMKEKRNTVSFLKWLVNDKVDQGSPPKKESYLQLLITTEHEDNILFVFTYFLTWEAAEPINLSI